MKRIGIATAALAAATAIGISGAALAAPAGNLGSGQRTTAANGATHGAVTQAHHRGYWHGYYYAPYYYGPYYRPYYYTPYYYGPPSFNFGIQIR